MRRWPYSARWQPTSSRPKRPARANLGLRPLVRSAISPGARWHARKFEDALGATERALALSPDLHWIEVNRAHALLFLGRLDEARALYLAHKGKRIPQNDNKTWDEVVREDFEALRKAGLDHPAFAEILAALEKK